MKKILYKPVSFLAACLLFMSCSEKKVAENELSEQEKKEGWVLLFDGKSTDSWHLYNKGKVPSAWVVKDKELHCLPADSSDFEHGDLVSDKEYKNYEFKFDWKISKGGNSGVFINVIEREDIPMAWASGPEYQLLEDSHYDYQADAKKRAGCLYGFYPQKNEAPTKPFGEWNQSVIKQENGKIEFYLNGILTAEEDFSSDKWKELIASSGFVNFPDFGKTTYGRIALQDWAMGIAFRNIKIREL